MGYRTIVNGLGFGVKGAYGKYFINAWKDQESWYRV
jgi:hypothetical protein